ncbi:MAG: hypothetical protein U1B80_05785 [Anaerolineaceae bacterium]|nr:hypothetical protein [Anaerolineaceae bacterium]
MKQKSTPQAETVAGWNINPFPSPQTMPDGWDMSELMAIRHPANSIEEAEAGAVQLPSDSVNEPDLDHQPRMTSGDSGSSEPSHPLPDMGQNNPRGW